MIERQLFIKVRCSEIIVFIPSAKSRKNRLILHDVRFVLEGDADVTFLLI